MPELDDVEARAVELLAGRWSRDVADLRTALLRLWSASGGAVSTEDVVALLSRLDPALDVTAAIGALSGAAAVGDARVEERTAVAVSTTAIEALRGTAGKPQAALEESLRRARLLPLDTLAEVLAVVGPLGRASGEVRGAAAWAVHRASNEATKAAAEESGASLVFVAERDACLECNAMSGATDDFELPPLHPFCRCEVRPYDDPEVPRALQREALRSVLRGFSLPSESEAARLRAAQAALRSGRAARAPKSVQAYARAAVRRGRFGRGRSV